MKWHQLGLVVLTATTCWISPYFEATAQPFSFTSWIELFNSKPRQPGEPKIGGTRGDLCQISPQREDKIWSDRPLFLLTEKPRNGARLIGRIELRSEKDDPSTTLWSGTPTEDEWISGNNVRKIINIYPIAYNGETALESGTTYHWLLFLDDAGEEDYTSWISFEVMSSEERAPITAELQELTDRLTDEGAEEEAIALERTRYFFDRELWADALQEAYSVSKPSAELRKLRQTLPIKLAYQRCGR